MKNIKIEKELEGSILDIGGGGEAIIGRLYTSQVTAIDLYPEELDTVPSACRKMVMNAAQILSADGAYDNITNFFTLMYMRKETQIKALKESYRVLKNGGKMIVWDASIDKAYPEPFMIDLSIDIGQSPIKTTYGVVKEDAYQNMDTVINLCEEAGFVLSDKENHCEYFKIILEKK